MRRKAIGFEDLLKDKFEGHYGQPQVISVPDEMDPEIPRMIFGSKHGYSQIIITQIGMTLNVTYSPDWQEDISKGHEYLLERSNALYLLFGLLEDAKICYSGLVTRVQLPSNEKDETLIEHLRSCYKFSINGDSPYDVQLKITTIHDSNFYNNITVQNYRTWKMTPDISRLSKEKSTENGVEIIGDYNDRFSFNEKEDYYSDNAIAKQIITNGLSEMDRTVNKIRRGGDG